MHNVCSDAGANVELMSRTALQKKFPWLSSDDLELASYGQSAFCYSTNSFRSFDIL